MKLPVRLAYADLWQNQETTGCPELTCSLDDNHLDHLKVRMELALGHEHE